MPHQSNEQRREEICQFEEASGSAGLPTATGNRITATSGETVQVKLLTLLHQPVSYSWYVVYVVQTYLPFYFSDLVHTTESLRNAKLSAGKTEKESRNFDALLEPYRAENARVVRENNELHQELLRLKEEKDRVSRGKQ